MGCGSSTTVQEFKQDRPNGSAKHDRKQESAKSRSSRSSNKKSHGKRSSSSSSSSSSSDGSRKSHDKKHKLKTKERKKKTSSGSQRKPLDGSQRIHSGGSQRIRSGGSQRIRLGGSQRNVNSGKQRTEVVVQEEHTEDNVTVIKFENNDIEELEVKKDDENKNDVKVKTKSKLVKAKVVDDTIFPYNIIEALMIVTGKNKQEEHEIKAKTKEERRSKIDKDKEEEVVLTDMSLIPLEITKTEEESTGTNYTIDDIVNHNTEVGKRDWFKYGQKVYSVDKLVPVVKERMTLFIECTIANYQDGSDTLFAFMKPELSDVVWAIDRQDQKEIANSTTTAIQKITTFREGYPVYTARSYGVTRKDLKNVLSVCFIGNIVEIEQSVKIERFKQSAENTIEVLDEDAGEYANDFKDQLNRWLQDYPNVHIKNEPPKAGVDLNEQTFPLPQAILFDPLILRNWIQEWVLFDTDVSEEGVWTLAELQLESLGDCHAVFANIVKEHVDESIPELDMTIDGEAAWYVIEVDIFKTDKTTEKQEEIWKLRGKNTNLNNPEWMERRRAQIGDRIIARHEMDPNIVAPFLSFAENLEISWKTFLALCEKDAPVKKRTLPDSPKVKELQVQRSGSVLSSKSSSSTTTKDNNSLPDIESVKSSTTHANTSQLVLNGDNNLEKEQTDLEEEDNNIFMTSTEEEIKQSNDTAENTETDNNMLILDDDKSDADNNVLIVGNGTYNIDNNALTLENTENVDNNALILENTENVDNNALILENTENVDNNALILENTENVDNNALILENNIENVDNNVLNLENDTEEKDNNVLNIETDTGTTENNFLDLENNTENADNNVLVLKNDEPNTAREKSGASSISSKSSRKSPGTDSGLDLDAA